jgi:prepilin-type N-terminal cleavage/methylation domain-containing protein
LSQVRSRGFTLVEMTVVVAVLAMLAAVVLPRFIALEAGQESRDFASALMRLGTDARLIAIETGQQVEVTFDEDRGLIVLSTLDEETLVPTENKTISVPSSHELSAFVAAGEFMTPAEWMLDFHPDGSGRSGGIEVRDGEYTYHITINGHDGTSKRMEGQLEEAGEVEWQAGELEQRV